MKPIITAAMKRKAILMKTRVGMSGFVFGLSIACFFISAKADNIAYFVGAINSGQIPGQFGVLNLDTGAFTLRGSLSQVLAGVGVANGTFYGVSWNTTNGILYSINTANGSLTTIGTSAVNYYDFGSTTNGLFAVSKDMNLYSINSTNGAATLIGSTGLGSPVGITIGLSTGAGNLYFTRGTSLYTLDTSTGAATLIGNLGGSVTVGAMVLEGGTLYGGADTPQFQVDTLNPITGAVTSGPSAGSAQPFWGLAPATSVRQQADDVEYAITAANQFGTIDFETGAFTQLGTATIAIGTGIGDMARPFGGLIYLTPANGALALLNPATLQTSTIGGLPANIMAVAFTPTGTLLGVAAKGTTLYTFNPVTAAIQSSVALSGTGFTDAGSYLDLKSDINGNTFLLTGSTNIWSVNVNSGTVTNVWQSDGTYKLIALGDEAGVLYGFTTDGHIIEINLAGGQTLISTESCASPIAAVCNTGATPGQPTLSIQSTNQNSVVLSWLAVSNQFQLQHNYNLTTSNWTTLTNQVTFTNSLSWIVTPRTNTADFFRLTSN